MPVTLALSNQSENEWTQSLQKFGDEEGVFDFWFKKVSANTSSEISFSQYTFA